MNIVFFPHKLAKKSKGNREHRQQHLQFSFCCCSFSLPPCTFLLFGLLKQFVIFRISFAYTSLTSPLPSLALASRRRRRSRKRKSFFRCASMVANQAGVGGDCGLAARGAGGERAMVGGMYH